VIAGGIRSRVVSMPSVEDEELLILGPPIAPLAQADLFLAERFAVGGGGILLVRRAVADIAIQNDEGPDCLDGDVMLS
jgi:hypothetical protein